MRGRERERKREGEGEGERVIVYKLAIRSNISLTLTLTGPLSRFRHDGYPRADFVAFAIWRPPANLAHSYSHAPSPRPPLRYYDAVFGAHESYNYATAAAAISPFPPIHLVQGPPMNAMVHHMWQQALYAPFHRHRMLTDKHCLISKHCTSHDVQCCDVK